MDRNLRIRMLLEAGDRVTKPLRDIAGGSTRAAQALKIARDRLKELTRAQEDMAGFRKLGADVRATGNDLRAAETWVAALAREIAASDNPTKRMTANYQKAQREVSMLSGRHREESSLLREVRERMRAAGAETRDLAGYERTLHSQIARTNEELAEQSRRVQQLADRSRRMGAARENFGRIQGRATALAAGGAASIGTGVAAGAPVLGSIKSAMAYQSVMTDIAQKANLSREEARQMGLGLLAAAKAANQLPDALQEGVDALSGFGLDPRQAVRMMTPIGRAATAYKAEIRDLSAAAFAANDNLKVPVAQTARVIDVMAQAGKSGAFEIKDMAQHFPMLTAAAQGLGQKGVGAVADLAAALQIARKGTGDSASAATNIANLLQKMAAPGTIKKFKEFGVDLPAALQHAYKESKTPLEAITELTNKTLKGDLSRLGFLFEDAQVQQALRPLIQNIDEYKRIRADAFAAKGVTDADFAERLKDGAEKSKQFAISAKVLGLTMGAVLLPSATALLGKLTGFATWAGDMATRFPTAAKWAGLLAGGLALLTIVMGGLAFAAAGALAPFAALSFVAGALGIGLLPVIGIAAGIVAGIAAIAAGAYLIYNNWGAIAGWFGSIWQAIRSVFAGGIAGIFGAIGNMNGFALGLLYRFGAAAFGWFTGTLPGLLGRGWTFAFTTLRTAIVAAFTTLPAMFYSFGVYIVKGLIRGIASAPGAAWSAATSLAKSVASGFKKGAGINSPSRVFMGFGGFISEGLALGIHQGASEPIRRVQRLSREVAAAMAVGAAVPAIAAGSAGGSAAAAGAAAALAAPAPVTINVYGAPGQSPQDIARAVRVEWEKLQREQAAASRSRFADQPDWS
ncbi:MAG: phage tail tape measure protein [Sphingomonas bacterium]|nr:phage tail tape measure protein [Sphingomonas bacterium]